jgi:hypothetical protein
MRCNFLLFKFLAASNSDTCLISYKDIIYWFNSHINIMMVVTLELQADGQEAASHFGCRIK